MATDLDNFRPLVATALAAFGADFHYGIEIAEDASRLLKKRSELDAARVLRHQSTD